jgi:Cu(I)/Ag(I) efflux system protein CusF
MNPVFALAAALAVSGAAVAQTAGHEGHAGHVAEAPADQTGVEAVGQIKAIDMKNGKVTIHHGPIQSLGWPAMTMTFQATPELLKTVKAGQNVKFTLKSPGNEVTAIQAQ